jgi:hypothetical protein
MIVASAWYHSSVFWPAAAGVIAVVVMGLAAIWATFRVGNSKRTLIYGLISSTPLSEHFPSGNDEIQIIWRGQSLANPYLAEIGLRFLGRSDIDVADWYENRPLIFDVKTPIISLADSFSTPSERPIPKVEIDGSKLLVGPSLIAGRQQLGFRLLVDGKPGLSLDSHLVNVKLDRRMSITLPIPDNRTYILNYLALCGAIALVGILLAFHDSVDALTILVVVLTGLIWPLFTAVKKHYKDNRRTR